MPVSDYTPSVDDVAAAMTARLKTRWNNTADTFTDETRPTAAQVQSLIDKAVGLVAARVGTDLPNDQLKAAAKDVVIMRVQLRIEIQFFPDQIKSGQSAWDETKKLFDEDFKALQDAVEDARAASPDPTDDDADVLMGPGGLPRDSFDDSDPLVGLRTIW